MIAEAHKFTRDEYHRMAETGLLTEDDRVELIEGVVTSMSPIGPRHSSALSALGEFFTQNLHGSAIVYVQNPLAVGAASEPQPDLMLLKPPRSKYHTAHPTPPDVLLVVEVADSSLRVDLDEKMRLYARAGIAEYWVVDLVRGAVFVHRRPSGDSYQDVARHTPAGTIAPQAFPAAALPLPELFA